MNSQTEKMYPKYPPGLAAMIVSLLLLTGVAACAICDLAISGSFTWSLFPISSIIFAWLIVLPCALSGVRGIRGSLLAYSIFLVPFLYVLSVLIKGSDLILPIGIRMALISIVYFWAVFFLSRFLKSRVLAAVAAALLLAVPVYLFVGFTLVEWIAGPMFDIWDVLSITVLLLSSGALFLLDCIARKKGRNPQQYGRA